MSALPDRSAIAAKLFADETETVRALAAEAALSPVDQKRVAELARQLVAAVRAARRANPRARPDGMRRTWLPGWRTYWSPLRKRITARRWVTWARAAPSP